MTREEVINSNEYKLTQASLEYWRSNGKKDGLDDAFEVGAEWMEKNHPALNDIREGRALLVDKIWLEHHEKNIKKEVIATACEWLKSNCYIDDVYLDRFRKAMEEEQ